jgi:DNA-binding MarR family transcriptional regulator
VSREDAVARVADELDRFIRLLLREGGRLGEIEPKELTATQKLALAVAAEEGPLRLGALAERMGTTDATATRTVDGLAALGLLERTADPADRRAVQIAATKTGARNVTARRRRLVSVLEGLLAETSADELEQLAELLTRLTRPDTRLGA